MPAWAAPLMVPLTKRFFFVFNKQLKKTTDWLSHDVSEGTHFKTGVLTKIRHRSLFFLCFLFLVWMTAILGTKPFSFLCMCKMTVASFDFEKISLKRLCVRDRMFKKRGKHSKDARATKEDQHCVCVCYMLLKTHSVDLFGPLEMENSYCY